MILTRSQADILRAEALRQLDACAAVERGEERETCLPVFRSTPLGTLKMLRHATIIEDKLEAAE